MNTFLTKTLTLTANAFPTIRWIVVLVLLLATLFAPEFAYACGISNGGGCGG
jgi:hypothetical protein